LRIIEAPKVSGTYINATATDSASDDIAGYRIDLTPRISGELAKPTFGGRFTSIDHILIRISKCH
jgi:hypothetical protein